MRITGLPVKIASKSSQVLRAASLRKATCGGWQKITLIVMLFARLSSTKGSSPEDAHAAAGASLKVTAESHSQSGGKLYDTEVYSVEKAAGVIRTIDVAYFEPSGKQIAELKSDFSANRYLPNSEFQDLRNGYSYKVLVKGSLTSSPKGEVEISCRKTSGAAWTTEILPLQPDMMTLPGTSLYLEDHLKDYAPKGGVKVIKFIVPSRAAAYSVKISGDEIESNHHQRFHIRPENFFVRLVAPRIDIIADTVNSRIIAFEGISNIRTADGQNANVKTVYKYEP